MAEEMVDNVWDESPLAPNTIPKSEHDRLAAAEKSRDQQSPSDMFTAKVQSAQERDARGQGLGR